MVPILGSARPPSFGFPRSKESAESISATDMRVCVVGARVWSAAAPGSVRHSSAPLSPVAQAAIRGGEGRGSGLREGGRKRWRGRREGEEGGGGDNLCEASWWEEEGRRTCVVRRRRGFQSGQSFQQRVHAWRVPSWGRLFLRRGRRWWLQQTSQSVCCSEPTGPNASQTFTNSRRVSTIHHHHGIHHPSSNIHTAMKTMRQDGMGWDGMGWDGMGWDGMGWDGMWWHA